MLIYSPKTPDNSTQVSTVPTPKMLCTGRIAQEVNDLTTSLLESSFRRWNGALASLIEGRIPSVDTLPLNISRLSGSFRERRYWLLVLCHILKAPDPKIRYQQIARYIEFLRQMGFVDSLSVWLQYLGDLYMQPDSVRLPTLLNQSQTITIPLNFWIRDLQIGETGRAGQANFEYSVDRIMDRQTRPHTPSYFKKKGENSAD